MKPIIVVLEDSEYRIEWLARIAHEADAVIWWSETVREFLMFVDTAVRMGRLALIIMDHDLGHADEQGLVRVDAQGMDGTDAAKEISDDLRVPIIVWSVNSSAAARMQGYLKYKVDVSSQIRVVPFLDAQKGFLHQLVRGALGSYQTKLIALN